MCQLAQVSRASYYRSFREKVPEEEAMEVRAAVQKIALEHRRRYGYRRVTAELRHQGMAVNHKRVARIMQEDHLLALRRRPWVVTTDSGHELRVYVNLARRMELTAPDQLWVADITYIRLRREARMTGRSEQTPVPHRPRGSSAAAAKHSTWCARQRRPS